MKITGIKTFLCHAYRTNWVFVKVLTDDGLHGVGEATLEYREQTVAQAVKELERTLVGLDPRDLRHYTGNLTAIRPADATGYWQLESTQP